MNQDHRNLIHAVEAAGFRPSYPTDAYELCHTVLTVWRPRVLRLVMYPNGRAKTGYGPLYIGSFYGRGWPAYTAAIARAVATNGRTAEENSIMLHALGSASQRSRLGWRNFYSADRNEACDALVTAGLMRKYRDTYAVTDDGYRALGLLREVGNG